ncbi:MAG: hypothetical protein M9920_14095 [Verrucomicrobiae bacterium]|nr:hypothetical protein [Verrucomicrobiae bacterium]
MNTKHLPPTASLVLCLTISLAPANLFAQGTLTPPGAPAPTMRTLTQIEPRTPVAGGMTGNGLLLTGPGSYYLTGNVTLTNDNSSAIYLYGNNISLDLNGFSVINGRTNTSNTTGISAHWSGGQTNVSVRNGWVVGFDAGVVLSATQSLIEDLTITDSHMRGINVLGNNGSNFVTIIRRNVILNTDLNRSGFPNNPATAILTQDASGIIEANTISGLIGLSGNSNLNGRGIVIQGGKHMLLLNNRISVADVGIQMNSVSRYRDNVTAAVTTAYTGGTNLGNNQ